MLFSEEYFYHDALDLSIPELEQAKEQFDAKNVKEAERLFASYLKKTLKPDLYAGKPGKNLSDAARKNLLDRADRICGGEVISVGQAYTFPDNRIDWSFNPTYNGFKEWTWCLSRHEEFVRLADAYACTGDEKYARQYVRMITSWIDQCECPENLPAGETFAWRTIEAGIRMLGSWHVAIHLFLHSPSVDDHTWVMIFRSVYEHAIRLVRFRTWRNWLIMEIGGLVKLSVLYPFFKEAKAWYEDGIGTLVHELSEQIYPDGFQFELTTDYHGDNLGNYRSVTSLCRRYGVSYPAELDDGIRRMYDLYPKLCRPDLRTPDINDGAEVYVPSVLSDASSSYPENEVYRWFASARKEGRPPEYDSIFLPYSGHAVMRSGWEEDAIWALFDGGPVGAGHRHEDKLSFQLYAYGASMLPDSGNFDYDTSLQRAYILSSRAHNTGLVDGYGQSRRDLYEWHREDIGKKAAEMSFRTTGSYEITASSYDEGYGSKIPESGMPLILARHDRTVVFFKKGWKDIGPFFVLIDDFKAKEGEHLFEVSFQLTADPLTLTGGQITVSFGNGASMLLTSSVRPRLFTGQYEPAYMGWRSIRTPGDHEHQPAAVVSYAKTGHGATFATVVLPVRQGETCPGLQISRQEDAFTLSSGDTSETFPLRQFAPGQD